MNYADQRMYRQEPGEQPNPITPEGVDLRYADGMIDPHRNRLVCVREDHREAGREAVNTIVAIDLDHGGEGDVLVSGSDFYGYPSVSRDGSTLAWLSWNHPNMPWDHTELWTADIGEDGSLGPATQVAGQLGRVDLSAGVVTGRPAVLRFRPYRVVESIPTTRRAYRGDGAN